MNLTGRLPDLPIVPYLEEISALLLSSKSRCLILSAETAAGKSTVVPLYLLDRFPGKIAVLEPRRLAAYAIADRISSTLRERPGDTVGYRMRFDTRVGSNTRIELMTEAVLVHMIQQDPFLAGYSVVVLDEFHERSVNADLALALLRETMNLRNDLYLIIMSATIDTERIGTELDAPSMKVPGRQYPVDIEYLSPEANIPVHAAASRAIRSIVSSDTRIPHINASILVFLPGIAEIRKTREALRDVDNIFVLHSSVPFEEQKAVLSESQGVDRPLRIILSSSIAETSLTVPDVACVVDSGLSRISRFDPRTGMTRLVTERESSFSAKQRAGRAGRTGPGICFRLWSEHDSRILESSPEITRCDLVPLVLECAVWGVRNADSLLWIDRPNPGAWEAACELLKAMGALDSAGGVTRTGRLIAGLGVHPRIAAVALAGAVDLAVRHAGTLESPADVEYIRRDLRRRLSKAGIPAPPGGSESPAALLAGFPDRLARHQGDGLYRFASGRVASINRQFRENAPRFSEWIVATDADSGEREGLIREFEALSDTDAEAWLSGRVDTARTVSLSGKGRIDERKPILNEKTVYGKIIVSERNARPEPEEAAQAVCEAILIEGQGILPWSRASLDFFARACYRNMRTGKLPIRALEENLQEWLVPFLPADGILTEALFLEALRWKFDGQAVDRDVPKQIVLENGIVRPLLWEEITPDKGPEPVLETRIQDLYGCASTPLILGEPVLIRMLSPARRPVQITRDLNGFWKSSWKEVRKEMKGRYPKHDWPEDPSK